jgi:hypothetical protein
MCCFICQDWENNQLSSDKAFILIGDSLKSVKDKNDRDHLMELCDKIVDSLGNYEEAKSES